MNIDLKGRVAIVTGGGRGIGREIALVLAREGVKTVVTDISQDNLDSLSAEFGSESLQGRQLICDVTKSGQIKKTVSAVVEEYGRIDVLVNNAGIALGAAVDGHPEDAWDAVLNANLKGTFLMCREVVPVMKRQKSGRIINASSFAAIVPRAFTAAYASSKAGVVYLTRVLAGELGPWNITVNCYAPGMVPTEMNNYDKLPEEKQDELLSMLTLHRFGDKRDVANLICFLASDLAGYITGTFIDVSGGKLTTQMPQEVYEAL
jgi:3-oxoacyl-[acyl-carrier protein] reductase